MKWTQDSPRYGDMIRVKVHFYHHYGIFADEQTVIQFGLPTDVSRPAEEIRVLRTDIDTFLHGGELEVASLSPSERLARRSPEDTVAYARSRLGEGGYHIFENNCEHFANDCLFGTKRSAFIDDIRASLREKLKRKG